MNALEWLNRRIEWHKNCLNGTPQKEIIPKLKRDLEMLTGMRNKLQALEIIKDKKVNLEYLKCCDTYEQYKTICSYWNEITKEEFDLLKEGLLWAEEPKKLI